jgi:hypothetical protein
MHSLLGWTTAVKVEPRMPGQVIRPSVSNSESHRIGAEWFAASNAPGGTSRRARPGALHRQLALLTARSIPSETSDVNNKPHNLRN